MTTAHYVRRSKRIGSMSNAPPGQKTITAARQFFDIPEMLDHLAGTLQWPELTNLANTSFYASKVVGRIIRGRIRSKSAPFFSKPEDMEALFEVLRRAHASITGSLAWYIMTAEDVQHTSVPLMDLNIIAPRGIENVLPCIDFFRNLGYKHIWCKTSSDPYKDVASRIISLQRRVSFHNFIIWSSYLPLQLEVRSDYHRKQNGLGFANRGCFPTDFDDEHHQPISDILYVSIATPRPYYRQRCAQCSRYHYASVKAPWDPRTVVHLCTSGTLWTNLSSAVEKD